MATVRQVAKLAGVSITTVSRVLNNHHAISTEVRQRVLAAANAVRYVPRVGRRSTTNIACLYTDEPPLASLFDGALLYGISTGLGALGLDLMILAGKRARHSGETFTQMFLRKGVCGAILRTNTATREVCRQIAQEGFPAVVVAENFDDPAVPCVYADSRPACLRAMDHLIHLGHRRIAITLNVVEDHDHALRLQAYRRGLQQAGLAVDERLILRFPAYQDAGGQALHQIMGMTDRPTAVFMTDPRAAVGLFHEALRMGVRIPADLSVIGFDDTDLRFGVFPHMAAVCQSAEALGRQAIATLIDRMQPKQAASVGGRLECWLELNDSTAPPPQTAC